MFTFQRQNMLEIQTWRLPGELIQRSDEFCSVGLVEVQWSDFRALNAEFQAQELCLWWMTIWSPKLCSWWMTIRSPKLFSWWIDDTLSDHPLLEPWMSPTVRLVDDHIFIALGFMPYRPWRPHSQIIIPTPVHN